MKRYSGRAPQEVINAVAAEAGKAACHYNSYSHGHASKARRSATYESWCAMISRCTRPSNSKYHLYGGRGIAVCDRWQTFANFLADMGERPEGKTLDRIDNSRGYEPSNCRWATRLEQAQNTRLFKLTPDLVDRIVSLYATGIPQRALAVQLGLSRKSIVKALRSKRIPELRR